MATAISRGSFHINCNDVRVSNLSLLEEKIRLLAQSLLTRCLLWASATIIIGALSPIPIRRWVFMLLPVVSVGFNIILIHELYQTIFYRKNINDSVSLFNYFDSFWKKNPTLLSNLHFFSDSNKSIFTFIIQSVEREAKKLIEQGIPPNQSTLCNGYETLTTTFPIIGKEIAMKIHKEPGQWIQDGASLQAIHETYCCVARDHFKYPPYIEKIKAALDENSQRSVDALFSTIERGIFLDQEEFDTYLNSIISPATQKPLFERSFFGPTLQFYNSQHIATALKNWSETSVN